MIWFIIGNATGAVLGAKYKPQVDRAVKQVTKAVKDLAKKAQQSGRTK